MNNKGVLAFTLMLASGVSSSAEISPKSSRTAIMGIPQAMLSSVAALGATAPPKQSAKILKNNLSISLDTHYYDWQNNADSSNQGYQIVSPLTVTYKLGNFDFGYRQAYIVSRNKTPGSEGTVDTFGDTALGVAYTFRQWRSPVKILLDYNYPSGEASLDSEENNVLLVDSYLTRLSQFGEGHNITPGINITHALNQHDVVGLGVGYTFRGKFDPNSERENDVIDPGDELNVTARWNRNHRNWSLRSGLLYTRFTRTQRENVDFFQKGRRRSFNLGGTFVFPWQGALYGHQLDASVRLTQQESDKNFSGFSRELERERFNVNGDTYYFTLAWSKAFKAFGGDHHFRVTTDFLDARQNDYPESSINFDAGRRRFRYGANYTYAFNRQGYFSITARKYQVRNKAERSNVADINYTGYNVIAGLNYRF